MGEPGLVVHLKLLGYLARVAGHRETSVRVGPGTTVLELLSALADRYGPAFASSIFRAPREVHTHLRVFVDGADAAMDDTIRGDGGRADVAVLVMPVFEGGGA